MWLWSLGIKVLNMKMDVAMKSIFIFRTLIPNGHNHMIMIYDFFIIEKSIFIFRTLIPNVHNPLLNEMSTHIQRLGLDKPECINIEEFDVYLDNTENI